MDVPRELSFKIRDNGARPYSILFVHLLLSEFSECLREVRNALRPATHRQTAGHSFEVTVELCTKLCMLLKCTS